MVKNNSLDRRCQLFSKRSGLAVVLVATSLTLDACQQTDTNKTPNTKTEKSQIAQNKSTQAADSLPDNNDWIVTEEDVWIPILDELGQHLQAAYQSFLKQDKQAAATQIRDASTFLKQELNRASSEGKPRLEKSISDLEKLAREVESGKVTSIEQLYPVFVQAHNASIKNIWLMIDSQQQFSLFDQLTQHWQLAHKYFLQEDNKAAASEIRQGTAFVFLEANRAKDNSLESAFLASTQDLKKLADEVEQGKVNEVKTLENAFAKGHLALARFYKAKAETSESMAEWVQVGYELRAAARHLEAGATEVRTETATNIIDTSKDALSVAEQLIEGNHQQAMTANKAIEAIGQQIETFSKSL